MTADQCEKCDHYHYPNSGEYCLLVENITVYQGERELDGERTIDHLEGAWFDNTDCNHFKPIS